MKLKYKILLVFGTRPEAIKMAPLVKELYKHSEKIEVLICVTAQHREMLDQVLNLFEIVADFDLNIMKPNQDLFDVTTQVLNGMKSVLDKLNPNIVFVHGDTTTSTAAALSAFYKKIPVAHIEAGLRTNNIHSPWPEEMNRQLTTSIAEYHFAPTLTSINNLILENVNIDKITLTGNTVIDALFWVLEKIKKNPDILINIKKQLNNENIQETLINSWISKERKLILITGHRRENFGQGFLNICNAIKELSHKFPNIDFVYPMHLNPNVREPIIKVFGDLTSNKSNIYFIEPLDYLPFVYLMNHTYIILTDSGGIQEEAPSLGKPVLVMRDTTERPEALEAGTVKLVGTDSEVIINEVTNLLCNSEEYNKMKNATNPYGNGDASNKIVNFLIHNIM